MKEPIEMSHNEIMREVRQLWIDRKIHGRFDALCIQYKGRFGHDITVGMLDLFKE